MTVGLIGISCWLWLVLLSSLDVSGFMIPNNANRLGNEIRMESMTPTTTTIVDPKEMTNGSSESAFGKVMELAQITMEESDKRRDAIGNGKSAGSSATNWIDERTSLALKQLLTQLEVLKVEERMGWDREEAASWLRWFQSSPTPLLIQLFTSSRIKCQLLLLPSGMELSSPFQESTGTLIYGKLLYGGIHRFRLLSSNNSKQSPKRIGEKTILTDPKQSTTEAWVQFGGTPRNYQAIDMGPAAILELTLLPSSTTSDNHNNSHPNNDSGIMKMSKLLWDPHKIFTIPSKQENDDTTTTKEQWTNDTTTTTNNKNGAVPISLAGQSRNDAFKTDFQTSVGGLQNEIDAIVRRVLDGRVLRPADDDESSGIRDLTQEQLSTAAMEAEELELLGLSPVRGLLLYGPPGCGKTALAREISKALRARTPKIVSAPELLDRWVGGSEKLVRSLFIEAEAELASCQGDVSKSALHVIVIDEIDAVFRKRSTSEDSGEATRSSAVNQILAKLDGVNAIPNVLLIGMTNRRELLDDALLRPGRLEVQIYIPLPNLQGRREILNIHFAALRQNGRLSPSLCHAIDGTPPNNTHTSSDTTTTSTSKRMKLKQSIQRVFQRRHFFDVAMETNGFSGADIAGLVRCAGSIALSRARNNGNGSIDTLLITLQDVKDALQEVKK